jgi:DNA modification methylase
LSTRILVGDVRERLADLPDESIHCVVTSPPYFGLRDYGVPGQIGLEATHIEFITTLVEVFRDVRRVMRDDATLWLNLGDSYAGGGNGIRDPERWPKQSRNNNGDRTTHVKRGTGLKNKDLMMVPARVAIALQDDGWWLRSDIIWAKKNCMPESVTDRPSVTHEHIFLLAKSAKYFYDAAAVREEESPSSTKGYAYGRKSFGEGQRRGSPSDNRDAREIPAGGFAHLTGRNLRNVWHLSTTPFAEAHFATFPPEIPRRCIKAGCPPGGTVLDPFGGAGTTALVAEELGRDCILIELNPAYAEMAAKRIYDAAPLLTSVEVA